MTLGHVLAAAGTAWFVSDLDPDQAYWVGQVRQGLAFPASGPASVHPASGPALQSQVGSLHCSTGPVAAAAALIAAPACPYPAVAHLPAFVALVAGFLPDDQVSCLPAACLAEALQDSQFGHQCPVAPASAIGC